MWCSELYKWPLQLSVGTHTLRDQEALSRCDIEGDVLTAAVLFRNPGTHGSCMTDEAEYTATCLSVRRGATREPSDGRILS